MLMALPARRLRQLLRRPAGDLRPLVVAGNSNYFVEYPEDIRLYGLSFSTTLAYRHRLER